MSTASKTQIRFQGCLGYCSQHRHSFQVFIMDCRIFFVNTKDPETSLCCPHGRPCLLCARIISFSTWKLGPSVMQLLLLRPLSSTCSNGLCLQFRFTSKPRWDHAAPQHLQQHPPSHPYTDLPRREVKLRQVIHCTAPQFVTQCIFINWHCFLLKVY